MNTYQKALKTLGISVESTIPASILLSGNIIDGAYDISGSDIEKLNALHDIIAEYNRPKKKKTQVRSSDDIASIMHQKMDGLDHEELWTVYLTTKNTIIDIRRITTGSINMTVCDNRRIIKQALTCNATGIIMTHNHPSGNPNPGTEDIRMTDTLANACRTFDIKLLDHVIIGDSCHYSFAEEKII